MLYHIVIFPILCLNHFCLILWQREINVRHLRESIGLVQQEPVLFAASIRENIIGGYPNVTQKQVEEAAIRANAHDFIMNFPDGYDTQVGNKGAKISGGQVSLACLIFVILKCILKFSCTEAKNSHCPYSSPRSKNFSSW